jgi:hypothetical protein
MAAKKQDQVLYELKGASLEAAQSLEEELRVDIAVHMPLGWLIVQRQVLRQPAFPQQSVADHFQSCGRMV